MGTRTAPSDDEFGEGHNGEPVEHEGTDADTDANAAIETDANADNAADVAADADGDTESDEGACSVNRLSKSQLFDVLRNGRRRAVIEYLRSTGRTAPLAEVTEHVAAGVYDVTADELSSEQYRRVYTGLYQCHLDRMEEFGVIDFDRDDGTVQLRDASAQLDPYLEPDPGPHAARLEAVAAAVVGSAVALGVGGVGPFGAVSITTWAAVTVLALLGLAVAQAYERTAATP